MNLFINNTRLVILIMGSLTILGIKGLLTLKRESIPPVDFARVLISTIYPGSSPKEVEELITNKIEDEIRSVEGIKDVHSFSKNGSNLIVIRTDIDNRESFKIVSELHHALQKAGPFPQEVLDPPHLNHIKAKNDEPILFLFVTGSDKSREKDKIAFDLKTRIEQIRGVSEVHLKSYKKREFQILLSPDKMREKYISLADVVQAVKRQSSDVSAGYLESANTRYLVRIPGKPRDIKALENIVIRSNFSGKMIPVKDVGRVVDGFQKEKSRQYLYQSEGNKNYKLSSGVSIQVIKSTGADTIALTAQIKKEIKRLKESIAPAYNIHVFYSEAEKTEKRLLAVINNALTGLLLVLVIFFFFLPSYIGLMAGISLPLSILAAFAILPSFGVTFNVITMLAFVICIGMLVDNSVVISEHYSRLLFSKKNMSGREAALLSVKQFWKPVTATGLTTIAAFLPMLVTTGVMGEFIKWIPIVVTVSLSISLFESFFLLPCRLQFFSGKKIKSKGSIIQKGLGIMESKLEIFLQKAISKKYISLGCMGFLLLSSFLVHKFGNRVDLFANRSPEFYTAYFEVGANTSLNYMDRTAQRLSKKMYEIIGPQNIQSLTVQVEPEKGEVKAYIKSSVLRKLNYKTVLSHLRKIDKGNLKKLRFGVIEPGPPPGKPFQAVIQSNNRSKIIDFIDTIYPEVEKIPGVLNLEIKPDPNTGMDYKIELKQGALSRLGLSLSEVGLALRTALEGFLIAELTQKSESFYIRIKQDDQKLTSLSALQQIRIKEPFGRLIPLGKIAHVVEVKSEPERMKYNFQPAMILQSEVDPKITTSLEINNQAKEIIDRHIARYPSLFYKLIGEQEATKESLTSLFNAMIIALFAIFIILIAVLKSFSLSFLVLSCIPLGLIGVSWAFFLHQRPLNFFSLIGVVGLSGVVVNSAIILMSYILKLKKESPFSPLTDIVVQASKLRFRPILITNLTTLGGLLPTAYGIAGYEPLLMPMTLAFFWGLLTATLITLIWIPCGVLVVEEIKNLFYRFIKQLTS